MESELTLAEVKQRAKNIPMKELPNEIEAAHDQNKYCVIFDKTDENQCASFFTYKGTLVDFHKEMLAVTVLNSKNKAEALETLRSGLVGSMRNGDTLVINVGELNPDFKTAEWQDS